MSNLPDADYRGRSIEVQSYRSDGNQWRPKAVVGISEGGTLRLKTVNAPVDRLFDTEAEAEAYSLAMARKWIDDHA